MWIRSQNKENLIDVKALKLEQELYNPSNNNFVLVTSGGTILGIYKPKERVLEVLDEIQETLSHNKFIEVVMPLEGYSKVELWQEYINTYEMPKE